MQIEYFQYLQIASFIIAVICYKGLKHFGISLFIALLFLDCVADFVGDNYLYFGWDNNYVLYNCYMLLSTPVSIYLFYKMFNLKYQSKYMFTAIAILAGVLIFINFLFVQGENQFNSYSLIIVMIMNIILSSLILVKLATDDTKLLSLYKEPFFWINAATLLFSLGTLVTLGLQQYILYNQLQLKGEVLYYIIMPVLNMFLYSALSYGFILCQQQMNKSLS